MREEQEIRREDPKVTPPFTMLIVYHHNAKKGKPFSSFSSSSQQITSLIPSSTPQHALHLQNQSSNFYDGTCPLFFPLILLEFAITSSKIHIELLWRL